MPSPPRSRSRRNLVLGTSGALAIALAIYLQLQVQDEVFFACDGGLKTLQVKQLAKGEWHADLRLPAPAWAHALWDEGFYPFEVPFVRQVEDRHYMAFGFLFPALSTPFYKLLDYRGLHLIGLLSTLIIWWCFIRVALRLGLGVIPTGVAFVGLAFAAPLTLYSAMFWEHSTAVALAFWGMTQALDTGASRKGLSIGGFLLGLSMWLRPECVCLIIPAAIVGLWCHPAKRAAWFIASAILAGALLLAVNEALYGYPMGAHGMEVARGASVGERLAAAGANGKTILLDFLRYYPILLVALVLLVAVLRRSALRSDRLLVPLGMTLILFLLTVPLIVPHFGGRQIGPRYLLPAAPLLWLLVAAQLRWLSGRKRWLRIIGVVGVVVALGLGAFQSSYRGTRALRHNFHYRALPALRLLRDEQPEVVLVTHQALAMHLQAEFGRKVFFRIPRNTSDQRLIAGLRAAGQFSFTLIAMASYPPDPDHLRRLGITHELLGVRGMFVLLRCRL